MKVETKYEIGDEVYSLTRGELIKSKIYSIEITCGKTGVYISYKTEVGNYNQTYLLKGAECYGSKQEAGEAWMGLNGLKVGVVL